MLLGFPAGVVMVLGESPVVCRRLSLIVVYWAMRKKWPRWGKLRQIHPVMLCQGPVYYLAPYNVSYMLPWLYVTLFSFQYIK
jgi:hypothetical protein